VHIQPRWGKTGVVNALPPDVADSLAAAHAARRDIHFDICTVYSEGPAFGCSCGVPRLFEDLVEALGVKVLDAAASTV
jgi:hypothetical protein